MRMLAIMFIDTPTAALPCWPTGRRCTDVASLALSATGYEAGEKGAETSRATSYGGAIGAASGRCGEALLRRLPVPARPPHCHRPDAPSLKGARLHSPCGRSARRGNKLSRQQADAGLPPR